MVDRALKHKNSNAAVLISVRTIDDVWKVGGRLTDEKNGVMLPGKGPVA